MAMKPFFDDAAIMDIVDFVSYDSDEDMGRELWKADPDFYMDCADERDIELVFDFLGCLDASV